MLLSLILITWQSLTPVTSVGGFPHTDKVIHAIAYACVAGLVIFGGWRRLWPAVIFAVLWGAGIELAQGLMDLGREASFADGVANSVGALVGGFLALALTREQGGAFSP